MSTLSAPCPSPPCTGGTSGSEDPPSRVEHYYPCLGGSSRRRAPPPSSRREVVSQTPDLPPAAGPSPTPSPTGPGARGVRGGPTRAEPFRALRGRAGRVPPRLFAGKDAAAGGRRPGAGRPRACIGSTPPPPPPRRRNGSTGPAPFRRGRARPARPAAAAVVLAGLRVEVEAPDAAHPAPRRAPPRARAHTHTCAPPLGHAPHERKPAHPDPILTTPPTRKLESRAYRQHDTADTHTQRQRHRHTQG